MIEENTFPFPILYEDNHLLIVVKPSGISTQPHGKETNDRSVETDLKNAIQKRDKKLSNVFLHAIFRLDKSVSGIVLFAKSSKALARLQKSQREHLYQKEYIALVSNSVPEGIMTDFLLRGEFKTQVVDKKVKNAKKAILEILSCKPTPKGYFEITISLITGRYHQIRAQLSSRKAPILGDFRYGEQSMQPSSFQFHKNGIALHHRQLSFPHPIQPVGSEVIQYVSVLSEPLWKDHL